MSEAIEISNRKMLYSGESIAVENSKKIRYSFLEDEAINQKYVSGEIRIITEQARYPLESIPGMLEKNNYKLQPDFQRRHVWDIVKRSRLIESFILNVPIPPIFLYEVSYAEYEVMDGLQRLTTINEFYKNKFALVELQEWPELNGKYYSNLPEQIKKGIDRRYLSSIILLRETAKSEAEATRLKQIVFQRINSGGVDLSAQETRNALYPGGLNSLCLKLSGNENFKKLWQLDMPADDIFPEEKDIHIETDMYKRMEDVELVLRYFAFRQIENWYGQTLEDFLSFYLKESKSLSEDILNALGRDFTDTIDLIYKVFEIKAFYLYRSRRDRNGDETWSWLEKPTKMVYDPMMYVFSNNVKNRDQLVKNKGAIQRDIIGFFKEHAQLFKGRSTNKNDVIKRINAMDLFIKNYL